MNTIFKTKNWKLEIDEKGVNKSLKLKGSNENLIKENQYFVYRSIPGKISLPERKRDMYVIAPEKSIVLPKKVEREGNSLKVEFENPDLVFMLDIKEQESSVVLKLREVSPSDFNYGRFFFGCFELNDNNNDIYSSAITHNIEVQSVEVPGYCVRCGAYATKILGDINKACEFVLASKADMRSEIKKISSKLSINDVIVSQKGGAFSDMCKEATLNYAEVNGAGFENIEEFLAPHKHLGINLFDIGHGTIFRQGDLTYLPEGGIEKFKNFIKELHKRGMKAGLHIYGAMIANDSYYVTPHPHKDLAAIDYYTLKEDLSSDDDELFIEEDTDKIVMVQQYATSKVCCFNIDDEIIVFEKRGENGRVYSLERGAFGTKKASHKKGAKIRHLARNFNHFNPLPGSELFYEIARKTADFYNECDFDLIYVDGLDVSYVLYSPKNLHWMDEQEYETEWYYSARFVQEILKNCKKNPMIEYSMLFPAIWAGRSRMGTFDTFFTGYKTAIDFHCRLNESQAHSKLLTSQLGWYDFYPMAFEYSTPYFSTYVSSYEFKEDVDYLGQKVIAYDSAVSSLSYDAKKHPQMAKKRFENESVLAPYCRLKEEGYFSSDIKEMLKSEEKCYKLIEKDGKYGFCEWERQYGMPYSFKEGENSFKVFNKFDEQKPFIRLLCTHTAEETEESFTIAKFDKETAANKQMGLIDLKKSKDEMCDLRGNEALGLWVKGNNSDEYMNIGLFGSPSSKVLMQSIIHLGFEGWRYFTLCEKDTNEAVAMKFNYSEEVENILSRLGYHSFYQPTPCFDSIYSMFIGFSGEGNGVYISDIKAIKPKKEKMKNPSVEINGEKITFICELQPSEYVEYRGGNTADVCDVTGKVREAEIKGSCPSLKNGENIVYLGGEADGVRRIKAYFITENKENVLC